MAEFFKVKAVSRLAGISPPTLRAWERRYAAVQPSRSANGRRVYSTEDIERLKLLSDLVHRGGYAIGGIAKLPMHELRALAERTEPARASASPQSAEAPTSETQLRDLLERLLVAIEAFDLPLVDQVLDEAQATVRPEEFVKRLVAPVLGEVGMRIERGMLSIAQEHALSVALRSRLIAELDRARKRLSAPKLGARKIAFATAEGDQHEFGVLMSAVLAACKGAPMAYLGPNFPASALADSARRLDAGAVVVGTTTLPNGLLRQSYDRYFNELDTELPASCQIWIGGQGRFESPLKVNPKRGLKHIGTLEVFELAIDSYLSHA